MPTPRDNVDSVQRPKIRDRLRSRLKQVGRLFTAICRSRAWVWVVSKLRWVLSGEAEHWVPMRLSVHVLVMVCLAGLAAMVLWDFFAARFPSPLPDDLKVEVVRLVMYVIAGLGGVVALVIAYRRQRLGETAAILEQAADSRQQTQAFSERFAAAAEQLSSDKAANRLAGVYAMASLADGWDEGRQTCINVLCAYMRMPYDPPERDPDLTTSGSRKEHHQRRAERQVRRTVMDVFGERLRADPVDGKTWHGHDLDFTGAVLDGGDLRGIIISGGRVDFGEAVFSSGHVDFTEAEFSGGRVDFTRAEFSGGWVDFAGAVISSGRLDFTRAEFSGSWVDFNTAWFPGGRVDFGEAVFSSGHVDFTMASFSGSWVDFGEAEFSGGRVDFVEAAFSGGHVEFYGAVFSGGEVNFRELNMPGGRNYPFEHRDWSAPPEFDDFPTGRPIGLLLPDSENNQHSEASESDEEA